jgi:hypothetical protein
LPSDEIAGVTDVAEGSAEGSPGEVAVAGEKPRQHRRAKDPLSKKVPMPSHAIWLHWGFGEKDLHTLEFDITFHSDPGDAAGEYFAPFNGYICDQLTYGGIQTNLEHPDGFLLGKGGLFSTWWTFDEADAQIVQPDGFFQLGTHEGNFLGVRRPFSWTAEHLRFTISRSTSDDAKRGGRWFSCSVSRLDRGGSPVARPTVVGEPIRIGDLRFEDDKGFPATIGASPLSFLEIYANARTYADIPDWHIDVMAYGNGVRAHSLKTEYPVFPKEVPNADAWYDPSTDRAHLRFGNETVREHAATTYF